MAGLWQKRDGNGSVARAQVTAQMGFASTPGPFRDVNSLAGVFRPAFPVSSRSFHSNRLSNSEQFGISARARALALCIEFWAPLGATGGFDASICEIVRGSIPCDFAAHSYSRCDTGR
jgi:hypothetical protein